MGIFNEQSADATESYVDSSVSSATNELNETINTVSGSLNDSIQAQYVNWDGGSSSSNYGSITGVDGGSAISF